MYINNLYRTLYYILDSENIEDYLPNTTSALIQDGGQGYQQDGGGFWDKVGSVFSIKSDANNDAIDVPHIQTEQVISSGKLDALGAKIKGYFTNKKETDDEETIDYTKYLEADEKKRANFSYIYKQLEPIKINTREKLLEFFEQANKSPEIPANINFIVLLDHLKVILNIPQNDHLLKLFQINYNTELLMENPQTMANISTYLELIINEVDLVYNYFNNLIQDNVVNYIRQSGNKNNIVFSNSPKFIQDFNYSNTKLEELKNSINLYYINTMCELFPEIDIQFKELAKSESMDDAKIKKFKETLEDSYKAIKGAGIEESNKDLYTNLNKKYTNLINTIYKVILDYVKQYKIFDETDTGFKNSYGTLLTSQMKRNSQKGGAPPLVEELFKKYKTLHYICDKYKYIYNIMDLIGNLQLKKKKYKDVYKHYINKVIKPKIEDIFGKFGPSDDNVKYIDELTNLINILKEKIESEPISSENPTLKSYDEKIFSELPSIEELLVKYNLKSLYNNTDVIKPFKSIYGTDINPDAIERIIQFIKLYSNLYFIVNLINNTGLKEDSLGPYNALSAKFNDLNRYIDNYNALDENITELTKIFEGFAALYKNNTGEKGQNTGIKNKLILLSPAEFNDRLNLSYIVKKEAPLWYNYNKTGLYCLNINNKSIYELMDIKYYLFKRLSEKLNESEFKSDAAPKDSQYFAKINYKSNKIESQEQYNTYYCGMNELNKLSIPDFVTLINKYTEELIELCNNIKLNYNTTTQYFEILDEKFPEGYGLLPNNITFIKSQNNTYYVNLVKTNKLESHLFDVYSIFPIYENYKKKNIEWYYNYTYLQYKYKLNITQELYNTLYTLNTINVNSFDKVAQQFIYNNPEYVNKEIRLNAPVALKDEEILLGMPIYKYTDLIELDAEHFASEKRNKYLNTSYNLFESLAKILNQNAGDNLLLYPLYIKLQVIDYLEQNLFTKFNGLTFIDYFILALGDTNILGKYIYDNLNTYITEEGTLVIDELIKLYPAVLKPNNIFNSIKNYNIVKPDIDILIIYIIDLYLFYKNDTSALSRLLFSIYKKLYDDPTYSGLFILDSYLIANFYNINLFFYTFINNNNDIYSSNFIFSNNVSKVNINLIISSNGNYRIFYPKENPEKNCSANANIYTEIKLKIEDNKIYSLIDDFKSQSQIKSDIFDSISDIGRNNQIFSINEISQDENYKYMTKIIKILKIPYILIENNVNSIADFYMLLCERVIRCYKDYKPITIDKLIKYLAYMLLLKSNSKYTLGTLLNTNIYNLIKFNYEADQVIYKKPEILHNMIIVPSIFLYEKDTDEDTDATDSADGADGADGPNGPKLKHSILDNFNTLLGNNYTQNTLDGNYRGILEAYFRTPQGLFEVNKSKVLNDFILYNKDVKPFKYKYTELKLQMAVELLLIDIFPNMYSKSLYHIPILKEYYNDNIFSIYDSLDIILPDNVKIALILAEYYQVLSVLNKRGLYFSTNNDLDNEATKDTFISDYFKIRDALYIGYEKLHLKPELNKTVDFYELVSYIIFLEE